MKTFMQRKEDVKRNWYVIDATDIPLGRLSTVAATYLKGKHKSTYTPHVDGGDFIVIINSDKVKLTGDKLKTKIYYNHSGYPGGLRKRTGKEMLERYSDEMVERSIKGMLPKNRLGRQMYKKLFVYKGNEHKQIAQKPEILDIREEI